MGGDIGDVVDFSFSLPLMSPDLDHRPNLATFDPQGAPGPVSATLAGMRTDGDAFLGFPPILSVMA